MSTVTRRTSSGSPSDTSPAQHPRPIGRRGDPTVVVGPVLPIHLDERVDADADEIRHLDDRPPILGETDHLAVVDQHHPAHAPAQTQCTSIPIPCTLTASSGAS